MCRFKLYTGKNTVCENSVTDVAETMYDFKKGHWEIHWRNQAGNGFVEFEAVGHLYAIQNDAVLIDEQVADAFKGITFLTFDTQRKVWVVRWLPASSTFSPNISARLENCIPVERHEQIAADGTMAKVRTSFTHITANRFEFHQDWSMDNGETWIKDVLFYEAIRQETN